MKEDIGMYCITTGTGLIPDSVTEHKCSVIQLNHFRLLCHVLSQCNNRISEMFGDSGLLTRTHDTNEETEDRNVP